MPDKLRVFRPETISDTPFPGQGEIVLSTSQKTSGETYNPETIKDNPPPVRKTAHELLSSALNTKSRKILAEFEFTEHGAIQIGKYTPGVSGDLRITPNGITARDLAGLTTFAIDGVTGSAVFKGTVQAGSIISESELVGGSININDRFTVDENGKVVIKDDSDETVIDAKGLVSTVSFASNTVSKTTDQTFSSTSWADITGLTLSFNLSRAARVLFMATVTGYYNAFGGQLQVRFNLNGSGVGPLMGFGYVDTAETVSAQFIYSVPSGSNTIKLQARDDGLGGSSGVINAARMPAVLNYVILGK